MNIEQNRSDVTPFIIPVIVENGASIARDGLRQTGVIHMLQSVSVYWPLINMKDKRSQIQRSIEDAYEAADKDFTIQAAVEWGDDFQFPAEVWTRDKDELVEMGSDLPGLTRRRQAAIIHDRLNEKRLEGRGPANPDVMFTRPGWRYPRLRRSRFRGEPYALGSRQEVQDRTLGGG